MNMEAHSSQYFIKAAAPVMISLARDAVKECYARG